MSEERHPQTILVAGEFSTANALAEWLTEKGFTAAPRASGHFYRGRIADVSIGA